MFTKLAKTKQYQSISPVPLTSTVALNVLDWNIFRLNPSENRFVVADHRFKRNFDRNKNKNVTENAVISIAVVLNSH